MGSLTYSEVGCREGVCSVAVLTDDSGGIPLLAVVVTSASYAGKFADGWREDHLNPSRVVANCGRKHSISQQERTEEQLSFCYSQRHRKILGTTQTWQTGDKKKTFMYKYTISKMIPCRLPVLKSLQLAHCFSPSPKSSNVCKP